MACNNNCENCNGCQDSNCSCSKLPCGCSDVAYETQCGYTQCGVGNERCDDVQCVECVSYCGTSFQIETTNGILKIDSGERLDQVIQKFALMIANGLGACTANNVHHAPYNVYAENITDTSLSIVWNNISSLSLGINVFYDTLTNPSGWVQANSVLLTASINDFNITTLSPDTEYKIKLTSTDGGTLCDSVEILVKTLV